MSTITVATLILQDISTHQPTLAHSWRVAQRVAHLVQEIAQALGLPGSDWYWPDLHEKLSLTAADWILVHTQSLASANLLGEFGPMEPLVADAVLHHHERPDKNDYPEGMFSRLQALDEVARWAPTALVEALGAVGE